MIQVIILSLKEMINKRIFSLGIVLSILYLLIYATGLHYLAAAGTIGDNQLYTLMMGYQILSLGWYISTLLIGTLAIMAGAGSISREIETDTVLSLASKPISRINILTGKFCAYSLMTILYSIIMLASVTLLVNYHYHLGMNPFNLLQGLALFTLFPLALLAVTHLLSTLFSTMAGGAISFLLYSIAIIGGLFEQMGALMQNTGMVNIGVICSLLLPSDAVYRMAVYYSGSLPGGGVTVELFPFGASSVPSNWMLLYAIVYVIMIVVLAVISFNRRDL